jgi:hypothetical protein
MHKRIAMRILLLTLFIACAYCSDHLIAQQSTVFPFQLVLRNSSGNTMINTNVQLIAQIREISTDGPVIWQEHHQTNSNAVGLVNLEIGKFESLTELNWQQGIKFFEILIDLGEGYVSTGAQELHSVPYSIKSLQSVKASNGIRGITAEGDTLKLNNGTFYIIPGISEANQGSSLINAE